MNLAVQLARVAASLAEAPELHRALGLIRSCRDLVDKLGPSCAIEDAVSDLDSAIRGLEAEIEDAPMHALEDAMGQYADHLRAMREDR